MTGDGGGDDDSPRFETARRRHEAILTAPESSPPASAEQARFRDRYDLPPFQPPRFRDDTPVRQVVSALEAEHSIEVIFVEHHIGSGWSVGIDGCHGFTVERQRDGATNVVVPRSPSDFCEAMEAAILKQGTHDHRGVSRKSESPCLREETEVLQPADDSLGHQDDDADEKQSVGDDVERGELQPEQFLERDEDQRP